MRPVPKGGYRFENLKSYSGGFKPSFFQEVSSPIRVTRSGHGLPEATLSVFEAPSIVPRIESQDSLFSIYLSYYDSDLVTDQARIARAAEKKANVKLLTKLEIPHGAAEKVRTDLGRIGMNNFKLFPDLVGLGAYMKEEHLQSVIDNLL